MSDDEAIIRRVLGGDVHAFREIVDRYQGLVYRLARNLLGRTADADDLAQDVFVAAFENLGAFDPRRAALPTWLLVIARNKCLNALKRRRPLTVEKFVEPMDRRTPEDSLARKEWLARFDAALAALPFEQRTAFVLAEIENLPYEEIARVEGVKLGTVKSRIRRAKDKLMRLLETAESEL
jgi:RNA polymerase sigma-70 factor (ECF subfamily)